MEIIVAILWYLALLVPGQNYTMDNIHDLSEANFEAANYVADTPEEMDKAWDFYVNHDPEDNGVGLPADWDKEPTSPVEDIIIAPGDDTIFDESNKEEDDGTGG